MAVMQVTGGRMFLPAEDKKRPDDRIVLHPETNMGQVLTEDGKQTLTEFLGGRNIITTSEIETQQHAGIENALVFEISK